MFAETTKHNSNATTVKLTNAKIHVKMDYNGSQLMQNADLLHYLISKITVNIIKDRMETSVRIIVTRVWHFMIENMYVSKLGVVWIVSVEKCSKIRQESAFHKGLSVITQKSFITLHLDSIRFHVRKRWFTVRKAITLIIGDIGSGKSSLLFALLNEMKAEE